MFEWFAALAGQFGQEVAMVVAVLYGGYKFKRIKTILASLVGSIGFVATMGGVVVGAVVLASAMGWVQLNPGQMLSDVVGGAGAVWDIVGKPLTDWMTSEVL